jgi:hypothetical protein
MSQDEEQHRRSRLVVETPTARREVVHSQTVRYPEERRGGYSAGVVATVALLAVALTVIVFLFLTNPSDESDNTNINVRTAGATQPTPFAQQPVIVQATPFVQPTPIIIQQPPPMTTTAPPPVIIQQAPAGTTAAPPAATAPAASGTDDTALQSRIDKAYRDDSEIAATDVMALVVEGKATLTGTVNSAALKQKAERLARAVKGVSSVENRIIVITNTP